MILHGFSFPSWSFVIFPCGGNVCWNTWRNSFRKIQLPGQLVEISSHWMTYKFCKNAFSGCWKRHHLVGGWTNPSEKIVVKLGSSSPSLGVKINNLWNHQPGSWYSQTNLGPTNISPQVSVTFELQLRKKNTENPMKNDVALGQWGLPISWVTLLSLQPRVRFNLSFTPQNKQKLVHFSSEKLITYSWAKFDFYKNT